MTAADRSTYMRERYGGSQAVVNLREQRRVRVLVEHSRATHPAGRLARILDLPSGVGRFTPRLRESTSQLVCSDRDGGRLLALRAAEEPAVAPSIVQSDLTAPLPFADGSFDLVFNFRFFHHVRDAALREHVARELVRVSARDLIVSYYHRARVHQLHTRLWRRPGHSLDLAHAPRAEFLALFERLGCEVISDAAVIPVIHANRVALLRRRSVS